MRPQSREGHRDGGLIIDTVELRRRTGTRRVLVQRVDLTAGSEEPSAGEFSVVDGCLEIDLVVEAVTEGVSVTGTATGRWTGPCRRCLEPIVAPLGIELREIFETDPTDGETWPIDDERIDLGPVLREAALLALPLAPLCRTDCAGPAPDRFPATVATDPAPVRDLDDAPAADPRWAALDQLRFEQDPPPDGPPR